MNITQINLRKDLPEVEQVIRDGFSETPDSNISDWFSITEMELSIKQQRGVCLKYIQDDKVIGTVHAMEENSINGKEGKEKWIITCIAVRPNYKGQGIGSQLLSAIENEARKHKIIKLFVHTNKDDKEVINFYQKNGYEVVGQIDHYYYAGSAVFLLKFI